ncbi:MAG: TetR/AcrR family transcriptional regulator [Proteobacteria bacterium]|nr:TetR/AcrR family transcriptional regulator [Pseudomonadota bacterium]MBU1715875.1 TetR/AcrR family transcriptional regulator [Pseudomonadota bacterium]
MKIIERKRALSQLHQDSKIEERRGHILGTALNLFTRSGYFNTSVHDIQRRAEVSIGSIYHHFKNKEGIAKALYDDLLVRMEGEMVKIMGEQKTCHDRCREVVSFLFAMTENEPDTMEFVVHARHREFLPDEKPICSSRPFTLMLEMVQEGIREGDIVGVNSVVAATAIFGGPLRMIHLRLEGMLEQPLPSYLSEVWQCAWHGVSSMGYMRPKEWS